MSSSRAAGDEYSPHHDRAAVPLRRTTSDASALRPIVADPFGMGTRGYRAIAELLRSMPDERALAEASAILGSLGSLASGDPRLAPLCSALPEVDVAELRDDWSSVVDTGTVGCADPASPSRVWACVAAELVPDGSRVAELLALATLADRAAWAERTGSPGLAAAIRDRRAAFLREHGRLCLLRWARRRTSARTRVLTSAGVVLRMLVNAEPA
jgi:hypothetical protein